MVWQYHTQYENLVSAKAKRLQASECRKILILKPQLGNASATFAVLTFSSVTFNIFLVQRTQCLECCGKPGLLQDFVGRFEHLPDLVSRVLAQVITRDQDVLVTH
jgi:hypothetical protein